jgi:DNA-binding IclR family transcriptional regulator
MTVKATSSIQVIARLSRLLDAIAAHDEPVSLKTLASATGLHPSTAFRILASLIEHGLVERSANGHYRLGGKLLQLGDHVRSQTGLHREVRPLRERFRNPVVGEPAHPGEPEDAAVASNAC